VRIDACLNCVLPICDDKSADCAFTQISRDYYREKYYPAFRSKEIARVMQWQRENKDKLAVAQAKYQQANRDKINARRKEKRNETKLPICSGDR